MIRRSGYRKKHYIILCFPFHFILAVRGTPSVCACSSQNIWGVGVGVRSVFRHGVVVEFEWFYHLAQCLIHIIVKSDAKFGFWLWQYGKSLLWRVFKQGRHQLYSPFFFFFFFCTHHLYIRIDRTQDYPSKTVNRKIGLDWTDPCIFYFIRELMV